MSYPNSASRPNASVPAQCPSCPSGPSSPSVRVPPVRALSSLRADSLSGEIAKVTWSDSKEDTARAFITGSIVFPAFTKDRRLPGVVCIAAVLDTAPDVYVLDMVRFDQYDFALAQFFQKAYDRWKLSRYVIRKEADEELEALRFWQTMAVRHYRNEDKIYPDILKIPIANDTQAFTPLLMQGEHLHIGTPLLKDAIGSYDETKPFSDAPHELQALCIALVFIAQRSWKAFESDRMERQSK